ncbi:hypothetical protein EDD85DRAFT_956721 [Armillaria nabsnona]|nr:hypothetical protein EDD85DRAFT_956721 [Armillaria nabsnona]
MPFSFILLNDVLALSPNLECFHARNLDLCDLQRPAIFICPVKIKLSACLFSSGGVHALLAYSVITCITIVQPLFPPATTPDPVFYGVPHLMRSVFITQASLWDVIRLFDCMPTYLAVFETVELDVIQGTVPNMSTLGRRIIVLSLGATVKCLLIHSVDAISPIFIFLDLSKMVSVRWFTYMTCKNKPASMLNMINTIPIHAPLLHVWLGARFTNCRWRLVPETLSRLRWRTTLSVAYQQLPPNRDVVNTSTDIVISYFTFSEIWEHLYVDLFIPSTIT